MFSPKAEIKFSGLCPDVLTSILGSAMIAIPSKLGNTVLGGSVMDKDEILKKSREENKDRDFVEEAVLAKANSIALCVGIFMCGIISILKGLLTEKGTEPAVWTVYFSVLATTMLVKFAKMRRRHELLLGLLYLAFCVTFFVFYLHDLLEMA